MKLSYLDILQQLETICSQRPQVNSVSVGDELEFDINKGTDFPRVFIKTSDSEFNGQWEYNFDLLVMDRVNNDFSNLLDVMSETHSILEDIVSALNYAQLIDPQGIILSPEYSYQDAQSSGWSTSFILLSTKGLECNDAIP